MGEPRGEDGLHERLAQAILDWPSTDGLGTELLPREADMMAAAIVAGLGLEQVGWWIEDKHRHSTPQTHATVCGEFRFTEEEDGCPVNGSAVYRLSGSDGDAGG